MLRARRPCPCAAAPATPSHHPPVHPCYNCIHFPRAPIFPRISQDAEGTTALSLCCRAGHTDCCRLLLANGACRLLPDARGNTPLHYAALRGHLGVLFMLLGEFADGPGQREELARWGV